MRLAFIGVGQAGGKIVDRFLEYEARQERTFIESTIAINTARSDLEGLTRVPEKNRVLIGQSQVGGHGVGADNELAAEIAHQHSTEIRSAANMVPMTEIDAFLIVAGLGGGTGSGAGPVIARELDQICTEPVYALGILPGEEEGGVYTVNTARSLQTYVDETDGVLLFDNDAWRMVGESVKGGFENINAELVRRFGLLFSSGELTERSAVGQGVVDASEIINTLGGTGISTVGYADSPVDGEAATAPSSKPTSRITSLVRQATLGRLTMPCELAGVERALVVISGPSDHLDRKGIERARRWIEDQTGSMEVRGGDNPIKGADRVSAVVLLSGVRDAPRMESIKERAVDAKDRIKRRETESKEGLEELLEDDKLDSLL
ncbi:MAG: tubulin/FtsZ family protein [Halobacteriales archaeon]